jgi:hypothetical protein
VGVEHGENDRSDKNNDQAGKRKIFYQTKRFCPFCIVARFHKTILPPLMTG